MKTTILVIIMILSGYLNAQESPIHVLFNDGIITYIDKSQDANFSISFWGDTIVQSREYPNIFLIDSSIIQITKYKIPDSLLYLKYDSISETNLFQHFRDYEFDYQQNESFNHILNLENIYFNNKYSKRMMIWYFKEPEERTNKKSNDKKNIMDSTLPKTFFVVYQLNLIFTANSNIIMINIPVMNYENLSEKLELIEKKITNSIRIFSAEVNLNTLFNQIDHQKKNIQYILENSEIGIQYCIPEWLNVTVSKHLLKGTYPDINNKSDEFAFLVFPKTSFDSFNAFEKMGLTGTEIINVEKLKNNNDAMTRYKVIYHNDYDKFILQNVFINFGDYFGFVQLFSKENTYDQNIYKFNEFIDCIKLK